MSTPLDDYNRFVADVATAQAEMDALQLRPLVARVREWLAEQEATSARMEPLMRERFRSSPMMYEPPPMLSPAAIGSLFRGQDAAAVTSGRTIVRREVRRGIGFTAK